MNYLSDDRLNHLRRVVELPELNDDRYRILKRIATGGMASVYLAEDRHLNRRVALKVMFPNDPENFAVRMAQEARIIANLEHPSIVPIHDVRTLDDGRVFYAMKYVEGVTLDQFVRKQPGLAENLRTFQKICEGVAFAHSRGVIHRDLKPSNIMVGSFGEVLIMDWGIAKVLSREDDTHVSEANSMFETDSGQGQFHEEETYTPLSPGTKPGWVMGTPAYMAPEQARGETESIDRRTDIYALGGLLYYILTDKPPFKADSLSAMRHQITQIGPVVPRQIQPDVARPLQAICLKAMSINALDRYDSVTAMADDISLFQSGSPVTAYPESVMEKIWRWVHKYRLILLIVIAYLITRFILRFWLGR